MYTTTYEYSPLPAESDRLLFFLQDGLCLPVTAALEDNFTGLINANGVAIGPSTNVSLRFEVNGSTISGDNPMLIGFPVAGVPT